MRASGNNNSLIKNCICVYLSGLLRILPYLWLFTVLIAKLGLILTFNLLEHALTRWGKGLTTYILLNILSFEFRLKFVDIEHLPNFDTLFHRKETQLFLICLHEDKLIVIFQMVHTAHALINLVKFLLIYRFLRCHRVSLEILQNQSYFILNLYLPNGFLPFIWSTHIRLHQSVKSICHLFDAVF